MERACVLVAEDDPVTGAMACTALRVAGFEVLGPFAAAGETLAQAARAWPDVCLIDVHLAREDGREPAATLAERFGARVIPTSVEAQPGTVVPFVRKPFSPASLVWAVADAVEAAETLRRVFRFA